MLTRRLSHQPASFLLNESTIGAVIVVLLSALAVRPFIGDSLLATDDGSFHLFRLMALDSALHGGVLYPRLFPDFAFGYGYPVLNFYSPASYYLAEMFHMLGAGYILSTKLMVLSTLSLSALFMYLWVSDIFGRVPAAFSAIAYLYFPYHLADAFVRGAFPEFAAFALFPATMWCFHRGFSVPHPYHWLASASIATALLVGTHNLSALVFAPVLIGYILLLTYLTKSRRHLLLAVLALALAAGLSSFYLLPALAEVEWVQIGQELGVASGYSKHLYSLTDYISQFNVYRYFPDQGTLSEHPFGRIQVLVFLLSLVSILVVFKHSQEAFLLPVFFLIVTGVAAFMLLRSSSDFWSNLRILATLQYPWRLQALLALSTAFLAGAFPYAIGSLWAGGTGHWLAGEKGSAPFGNWRGRLFMAPIVSIALGAAIIYSGIANLPQSDESIHESDVTIQKMWSDDAEANQIGATWTAEFLPVSVKEERWRIPRSAQVSPAPSAEPSIPPPAVELLWSDGSSWSLVVDSLQGLTLSTHAFYFPGWRAWVDGQSADVHPVGSLGLASVDVPAGRHGVRIEFGSTMVRDVGTLLTLLSFAVVVTVLVTHLPRRASLSIMTALVVLGIFAALHLWPRPPATFAPLSANLQNAATLIGFETERVFYRAGENIRLKMFWMGWETTGKDFKVFIHLVPEVGAPPLAQHDADPVGGFTPSSRWLRGELLVDEHELTIPQSLEAGKYRLEAGMYDPVSIKNLQVLDLNGSPVGERVFLGEITVAAQ